MEVLSVSHGFTGRVLRVDLTGGRLWEETPDENFYRKYLGGKGFIAHYLLKEVPSDADPLGPDNRLVFATGVVTGAPMPGFSRFGVGAKSPLTGAYGESEAGGFWAAELKFAGYDAVVIQGRAESPVYLWIHDGEAELKDAGHLWGLTTEETEARIAADLGEQRIRTACIGPAGEAGVRYACVMHGTRNAAGRGGMGAVMGAKRLKAVAVRGKGKFNPADPGRVRELVQWFAANFKQNPPSKSLYDEGTLGVLAGLNAGGMLPTRNFSAGRFEGWQDLARVHVAGQNWGCYACPVRCKHNARALAGEGLVAGPEYETVAAFGSNLGCADAPTIVAANLFCNRMGLDTISAGVSIAWAYDAFQRGLLSERDTGGMRLEFGDPTPVLPLLEMIVRRQGIGEVLALGSRRAAEIFGQGSVDFAMQVKGQELPMHDPRGKVGVGLGYAVGEHGADHMTAAHDTLFAKAGSLGLEAVAPLGILASVSQFDLGPDKVRLYVRMQNWWDTLKSLSLCFFTVAPRGLLPVNMLVDAVRAVTGWDTSLWELLKAGERAGVLARLFNVRSGFGPEMDRLPAELANDAENPGITPGAMDDAVKQYYAMRGWDPATGRPTRGKLEELELGWAGPEVD